MTHTICVSTDPGHDKSADCNQSYLLYLSVCTCSCVNV